jgi:hypothetical protein
MVPKSHAHSQFFFPENISGRRNGIAWTHGDRKQKLKVAIIESNGVFLIAIRIENHACRPVTFLDACSSKGTHFDTGHSFTDVIHMVVGGGVEIIIGRF